MISCHVFSKIFFLQLKGLARLALITKKEYGFGIHFCKDS